MSFIVYDITFLVIFCLFVFIFLYRNRKNVKREMGFAFLYRSQTGIEFINYVGKNYQKTLKTLRYFIIVIGYLLMGTILFLIGKSLYLYFRYPVEITKIVKAPPIAPLIPYFPQIFNMESFFPPFYFTYFLVAIAIVATVHELAHGIYLRYNKVKIKSTGIAFFGPIPGAFVEQDERGMKKVSKINQMSILGAGVFANVITGILFFIIWVGIFYITFIPAGATFNTYAFDIVNISSISEIGGVYLANPTNQVLLSIIKKNNLTNDLILNSDGNSIIFTKIAADGQNYFITIETLKEQLQTGGNKLFLYEDYPAINVGLKGTIVGIDGNEIKTYDELAKIMENYSPNNKINITTNFDGKVLEYEIILKENSENPKKPMIGVGNNLIKTNSAETFAFFKKPFTEYKTKGEFYLFLYYLIFWVFLINLLVAIFNMLPVSILDGGRFFYLTIFGITGNKKIASKIYSWLGRIILFIFILIMVMWIFGIAH